MAKKQSSKSASPKQPQTAAQKRDALRAKKDAAYTKQLKRLQTTGYYTPKSLDITPYRKRRINALTREVGNLIDADKFFFVKTSKRTREAFRQSGQEVSRKGVFFPREPEKGHYLERGKLVRRKGRGRFDFIGERTVKNSKIAGRHKETFIFPGAGPDALMKSRRHLGDMAKEMGAVSPGPNKRFRFVISDGQGSFMSKRAFSNLDDLWAHALSYRKKFGEKVALIDKLTVVIVEKGQGAARFSRGTDLVDGVIYPSETTIDPELLADMEAEAEFDQKDD